MSKIVQSRRNDVVRDEIIARQGLRLPAAVLQQLRSLSIYCQPTISIEQQNISKEWVLRGVESGGAVSHLGAYSSFVAADGNAIPWLQRVDSIRANGVHAIAIAPVLVRIQMIRIERTYDVLVTRHTLVNPDSAKRAQLESSILFYGRRGNLEMELWGKDHSFQGTVRPVFYSRSGELLEPPAQYLWAIFRITAAVCCVGCRHCHLVQPKLSTLPPSDLGSFSDVETL